VTVTDDATERPAAALIAMAAAASPPPVAALATRALTRLAEVEAHIHQTDPDTVHLHELGGHDTLIDIVGVAAAIHALAITGVYSGPIPLGSGTVRTRHGILPVPAPATAALLATARVRGSDLTGELVTPTAAVLLDVLAVSYQPCPPMTLTAVGYGAGTRELADRANVVQALLGTPAGTGDHLVHLETNLDDVTGEVIGHTVDLLLRAGAADVWTSPILMKKGRPAVTLHVLAHPTDAAALSATMFAETGTLGIRSSDVYRAAATRTTSTVDVHGLPIRIKHIAAGAKPEYDDVRAAAHTLHLTYREVVALALTAAAPPEDGAEPRPSVRRPPSRNR
jgi:uncharacterized protein (TIGR00299 family) protein